jgi:urease accessory protein
MILVDSIIGNLNDSLWKERLEGSTIDWLVLDQWDAQKNRFRRRTRGDLELAVALDRSSHLHDGDILLWDSEARTAVVARIELKDVMVIELTDVTAEAPEILVQTCIELGHALGNQHWPAVVKGTKVYVPLTVDRVVMASVMRTHSFSGISYGFLPGAEIIPYLAPHEARRLFGGADATPHSHAPAHNH